MRRKPKRNAVTDASDGVPTFEGDIKSLFRERDRAAMIGFFDLWSLDDVKANAEAILAAARTCSMPCDGPWPNDKVDLFGRWADSGTLR